MQKKSFYWIIAAILTICGASVYTVCTLDNDDNGPKKFD